MENKRRLSWQNNEGKEKLKRVRRTSERVSNSPATSDIYEPEEWPEKLTTDSSNLFEPVDSDAESENESPNTSELFEPDSDSDQDNIPITPIRSPNSSDLYEPVNSSEARPSSLTSHKSEAEEAFSGAVKSTESSLNCGNDLSPRSQSVREDEDLGCLPLPESDEESQPSSSLRDRIVEDPPETCFDFKQLNGALVFVHLPGSSTDSLKQIIRNLKKCGAQVSQFFHKKIAHLITSNNCIEMEKRERMASKKLLTDSSSRSATLLARATKEQTKVSIFEKAKFLGINIVYIDEMNVFLSRKQEMPDSQSLHKKIRAQKHDQTVKVRKLRPPFIKVVDRKECYRPLVLEMKEWPDALTMFSKGPLVLDERTERKRQITFCELCNVNFNDLQNHLSSCEHTNNATNSKVWERVDALRAKLPTVEQLIEAKIKQLK